MDDISCDNILRYKVCWDTECADHEDIDEITCLSMAINGDCRKFRLKIPTDCYLSHKDRDIQSLRKLQTIPCSDYKDSHNQMTCPFEHGKTYEIAKAKQAEKDQERKDKRLEMEQRKEDYERLIQSKIDNSLRNMLEKYDHFINTSEDLDNIRQMKFFMTTLKQDLREIIKIEDAYTEKESKLLTLDPVKDERLVVSLKSEIAASKLLISQKGESAKEEKKNLDVIFARLERQSLDPTALMYDDTPEPFARGAAVDDRCPFCWENPQPGDLVRRFPCGDFYHLACAEMVFPGDPHCPVHEEL